MSCCNKTDADKNRILDYFTRRLPELNRNLPRLSDVVVKTWLESDRQIYLAGDTLSFHAPVGNTSYYNEGKPAEIIISGFCVAGEAGLRYLKSSLLSIERGENIEALHTFDTPNMTRGMSRLIEDIDLHRYFNLRDGITTLESARKGEIPLLLTQALCPIVVSGSSKADAVWKELMNQPALRCFIGGCLNWWWKTVNTCSDKDTIIFLMGARKYGRAELSKLLAFSKLVNDNIEITGADQNNNSVLVELKKKFNERVYCIKHAAWYGRN